MREKQEWEKPGFPTALVCDDISKGDPFNEKRGE